MMYIENAAGAGTETGGTETVIETKSHRGGSTVVEVGMENGAISGMVLVLCSFDVCWIDSSQTETRGL